VTTTAPTVFEEGDTTAPTVNLIRVKQGDPGAGMVAVTIKPPKRLRDRPRRFRLQVWSTDMAEIDSEIHSVTVTLGHS
jgi:hypothetical protein